MARPNALGVTLVLASLLATAAAQQEGPVQLERLRSFEVHSGNVTAAAFSPSGDALACGGTEGDLLVFDMPSQQLRWRARKANRWARAHAIEEVAFSPSGRFVASGGHDLTVYDARSGLATFRAAKVGQTGFDWSDDSKRLVYARGKKVYVHRVGSRDRDTFWGEVPTNVTSVSFARDGSVLVGDMVGTVRRLAAADPVPTFCRDFQIGRREAVRVVAVAHRAGTSFEVPSLGGLVRGKQVFAKEGTTFAFAASDDGQSFAVGGEDPVTITATDYVLPDADNTVRWWQRAGEKLTEFDVPGRIAALAFHPNGRDLFVSTFDGHQGVYRDGKLLQMTPGTPAKVSEVRLSADGSCMAVKANRWALHSLDNRFVRKLDNALEVHPSQRGAEFVVQQRERAVLLDGHTGDPIAVYDDGKPYLSMELPAAPGPGALVLADRKLRDRNNEVVAELPPEFWAGTIGDIAHGSDGSWAISGASGSFANWGGLFLGDDCGTTRKVLAGVPVFSIAFTPDARRLYYSYQIEPKLGRRQVPTALGVMDTQTGKMLSSRKLGCTKWRFLDERHALAAVDGELQVWNVDTDEPIQTIASPAPCRDFELSVEHGLLVTHTKSEVHVHRLRFEPK